MNASEPIHPNSAVRKYLCQAAKSITDASLKNIDSLEQWQTQRADLLTSYFQMQGFPNGLPSLQNRHPLNPVITGTLKRKHYTIEKLYFEVMPQFYMAANVYAPINSTDTSPAIIYVCGHSNTPKVNYQAHCQRFAELGFVCIILDTLQRGEIKGMHHGCYRFGQFQWYSRGYTPGGAEMYAAIRAIDYLSTRADVDSERIGITGNSGGGGVSWWTAIADPRIKAVAPVCGTGTVASHVIDKTWDDHCDCMMFLNTIEKDLSDCGALIAPRPLMIVAAENDLYYRVDAIREIHQKIKRIYALYGMEDSCTLSTCPGKHGYHPPLNKSIFKFFLEHLMDIEKDLDDIEDLRPGTETFEDLQVYADGYPTDQLTATIQDHFVPLEPQPSLTPTNLATEQQRVRAHLQHYAFAHFPKHPPELNLQQINNATASNTTRSYQFTTEGDWRLSFTYENNTGVAKAPCFIYLHAHNKDLPDISELSKRYACIGIDCRGINSQRWDKELQWHVRRNAALIGRTIASMQTFDVLRLLEAIKQIPEIDAQHCVLMGHCESSVPAIYAALLNEHVTALVLDQPPASHDADDDQQIPDSAIELFHVLQATDLPHSVALLSPRQVYFVDGLPTAYQATQAQLQTLGSPLQHIQSVADIP